MNDMESYLARVRDVLESASDRVGAPDMVIARQLVDHGEPAEGLLALSWAIVDGDVRVDKEVIDGIRELTAGLIEPRDLPTTLDSQVITCSRVTDSGRILPLATREKVLMRREPAGSADDVYSVLSVFKNQLLGGGVG